MDEGEWDAMRWETVFMPDGKRIDLMINDHFTPRQEAPLWSKVHGPDGLITDTVDQMKRFLGITTPPAVTPQADVACGVVSPARVAEHAAENARGREPMIGGDLLASERFPAVNDSSLKSASSAPGLASAAQNASAASATAANTLNARQKEQPEVKMGVRTVSAADEYRNDDESDDDYQDEDYEAAEDDRPWPITRDTLEEIDDMSPSDLECLLQNLDKHEEWEDLRKEAKERTAHWLGAVKKAKAAPRCEFVKLDGRRCGSPAMKGETTCYFHGEARAKRDAEAAAKVMEMPTLEDRMSVQLAIMRICARLTDKSIDEKTARVMISALRLAQRNLGNGNSLQ